MPTPLPHRWRSRLLRVLTALLGVLLLGVAVGGAVRSGRAAALDDLDHALTTQATTGAAALREYFERAQSINLLLAHDAAIAGLEPEPGTAHAEAPGAAPHRHGEPVTGGTPISTPAAEAMAYLERLYPGRISEACLINSTGTEIARVVRGLVAPEEDLSTEEAEAPFFAPTLALPADRVHQAAPYLSPDTDEWVISNSTPMIGESGTPWGLVHFEVTLDSFRAALAGTGGDRPAAIVDNQTGRVVLETGRPLTGGEPESAVSRPGSPGLAAAIARTSSAASDTVDGERIALVRLPGSPDNANSWSVLVSAPVTTVAWSRAIGPAPVAMTLAGLLLLAFAGLNLRASQRELRAAGLADELTGLPNRRLLTDRLDQALLLSGRRRTTCGVLLIDLDRFKEVNDTLGHHVGDVLLCEVANRLRAAFRDCDTVARLGGDEFAVLLTDVADERSALALARRCVALLQESFVLDGIVLNVEASIGVALAPQHGTDGNALLRVADVAMYEAKGRRCGVVVYEPNLDVHTPTRLALLGELRRAMQDDELFLDYQPKVELDTGQVHGVEALVRWQHPVRGVVAPNDFVPVAEGTGLILPLTLRTLDLAIAQARAWSDGGHPVQVAVNLSPRCLLEPDFPALVRARLEQHALPAGLLRLEITESTIMADPTRALAVLQELQAAGISLSIDDFGTGYSSMSYLKRLPVDELKIDRSFVLEMLTNPSDSVLVRSSIDLGHNLGLAVVAEGVEDEASLQALSDLGCDVVQGYHLGRPMTSEAFTSWLAARSTDRAQAPT